MPIAVMPRVVALSLSSALVLAGVSGAVAQEPVAELVPIPPPSLELALAALAPPASLLAGSDDVFEPAAKLPACKVGDVTTRYTKVREWRKTLLDTNLRILRSYQPWDLVSVSRADIKGSGKVRKVMIEDLRALAQASRRAGKPLAVRSAYRSYDYQQALFDSYTRTYGYQKALTFSARPGHSEHQLGTTVDFTTAPGVPLSTRFGDSPAGKWLARNGWKYGFIMSYPKGAKRASCYQYEPWHWRYVGRTLARKIHESGQVPRRYLWQRFETAP